MSKTETFNTYTQKLDAAMEERVRQLPGRTYNLQYGVGYDQNEGQFFMFAHAKNTVGGSQLNIEGIEEYSYMKVNKIYLDVKVSPEEKEQFKNYDVKNQGTFHKYYNQALEHATDLAKGYTTPFSEGFKLDFPFENKQEMNTHFLIETSLASIEDGIKKGLEKAKPGYSFALREDKPGTSSKNKEFYSESFVLHILHDKNKLGVKLQTNIYVTGNKSSYYNLVEHVKDFLKELSKKHNINISFYPDYKQANVNLVNPDDILNSFADRVLNAIDGRNDLEKASIEYVITNGKLVFDTSIKFKGSNNPADKTAVTASINALTVDTDRYIKEVEAAIKDVAKSLGIEIPFYAYEKRIKEEVKPVAFNARTGKYVSEPKPEIVRPETQNNERPVIKDKEDRLKKSFEIPKPVVEISQSHITSTITSDVRDKIVNNYSFIKFAAHVEETIKNFLDHSDKEKLFFELSRSSNKAIIVSYGVDKNADGSIKPSYDENGVALHSAHAFKLKDDEQRSTIKRFLVETAMDINRMHEGAIEIDRVNLEKKKLGEPSAEYSEAVKTYGLLKNANKNSEGKVDYEKLGINLNQLAIEKGTQAIR